MPLFISCDWGTSAFRLRVIDSPGLSTAANPPAVLASFSSGAGIASTHAEWQTYRLSNSEQSEPAQEASGPARETFYRSVLERAIGELKLDLRGVPVVISGMASSSIGMV